MKKLIVMFVIVILAGCNKEVRRKNVDTRTMRDHESRLYIWEGSDGDMNAGYFTNPRQILERIKRTKGM